MIVFLVFGGGRVEASQQTTEGAAPSATDREDPPGPSRRAPTVPRSPSRDDDEPNGGPEKARNPLWGLVFEVGLGGGGGDLVRVALSDGSHQTLSAGDGVAVSLGVMVTPLWWGDRLGVGASGTLGYKGWSVGGSRPVPPNRRVVDASACTNGTN